MYKKISMGLIAAIVALMPLSSHAVTYDELRDYQLALNIAQPSQEPGPVGAAIPVVVNLFETSLQGKISTSDTSMTLVNGSDRQGNILSGYTCFTIDEGSNSVEYVCGTASSTSVTSMTRGIDPITGVTSVPALKKTHNRGASVKITDYPVLGILSRILNGSDTLPNVITYDPSVSSSTIALGGQNLASVSYVNSVAVSGAPDASTAQKGLVESATGAETASGTPIGGTGALLFVPTSMFNATSSATTLVPVTNAAGKLSQGFLDLSASSTWTFSGPVTSNATTTILASSTKPIILDGVRYVFPTTQGAATTTLINNGSGTLSWGTTGICKNGETTHDVGTASGTQTIAHGLGVVPKIIRIFAIYAGTVFSNGTYNGTTTSHVRNPSNGDTTNIIYLDAGGGASAVATTTVDSTNITLGWTKSGSPTGNSFLNWEACSY